MQPSLAPQQLYQTRRFDSSLTSARKCRRITYGGLVFFFFFTNSYGLFIYRDFEALLYGFLSRVLLSR